MGRHRAAFSSASGLLLAVAERDGARPPRDVLQRSLCVNPLMRLSVLGRLDANGGQMKRNKSDFTYISCTFGMMPAALGPALPATAMSQLATQRN